MINGPNPSLNIKLTQTVQKGGCAAKIAAAELRQILSQVQFPLNNENVLVDGHTMDDAGIFKVSDQVALVQTLDFFTPIVDSPYLFGKIAAANALSDVYAMGGRPQTSMAILAFPMMTMDSKVGVAVLQGASDIIAESKSVFIGGHSIDDETLKFGLSVTGFVHPEKIWTNANAQVDDLLILTKPVGTGAATAALKKGLVTEADISDAIESMTQINNIIDFLSDQEIRQINSATDLTGFGFAGHAMQMAKASKVSFEINMEKIPLFRNFQEFIQQGCVTKAHRTNREYTQSSIDFSSLPNELKIENMLQLFDPQTSGGLFLSVSPSGSDRVLNAILTQFPHSTVVGRVVPEQREALILKR
jgi:selenide, water dikinase